jgi:hypothetical protein
MNSLQLTTGKLNALYGEIEKRLQDPQSDGFSQEEIRQSEILIRLLANEWKHCDPIFQLETSAALAGLKNALQRILRLAEKRRIDYLQERRDAHRALEELQNGSKFFQSMNAYQQKVPRYIDSSE